MASRGSPRRRLSSILFLLDFVLRALSDRLGSILRESVRISHIAYADDVLLLARKASSFQGLLNPLHAHLLFTGLEINCNKSFVISWRSNKKRKTFHDADVKLCIGSTQFRTLSFNNQFHYLGVISSQNCHIFDPPPLTEDLL